MNQSEKKVLAVADGVLNSKEIAAIVGLSPRYVRRILHRHGRSLPPGAKHGEENHQFAGGRRITHNGYAMVTAPDDHPYAIKRSGRTRGKLILEHRLVLEQKLGRYLLPEERVDHIDGLTLHNHPDNLRVFQNNADHLRETLTGKVPQWTDEGYLNMKLRHHPDVTLERVDIHQKRVKAGAARLRQILRLALQLGIDSPYLLGTQSHTKKAGIDMSSRSTIQHAWVELCQQWGWDPSL
jgi:hypothetical protein